MGKGCSEGVLFELCRGNEGHVEMLNYGIFFFKQKTAYEIGQ